MVGTAGIQQSLNENFFKNIELGKQEMATIGLIIFDTKFRGLGLGKAVVWSASYLYSKCTNIVKFGAGMEIDNVPSFKSFMSCGYELLIKNTNSYKMVLNIKNLKKPKSIKSMQLQSQ